MKDPKNIIITGASSGIGYALAKNYAKTAKNLLLIARNTERLLNCKKACSNNNAKIHIETICVKDEKKIKKAIKEFDQKHPVDLIIANAGISAGTSGNGESQTQLNNIFQTNIFGVTNVIYPLLDNFKQRKRGQIAIISSIASLRGLPSAPAYSSSKACIRYLGEALRGDLKKYNIKVNIICPGYIKTPMTDQNNFPMPFLMNVDQAAQKIIRKLKQNKPLIFFPKRLYYLVKFTKLLPIRISDKIYNSLPKK